MTMLTIITNNNNDNNSNIRYIEKTNIRKNLLMTMIKVVMVL